MDYIDLIINICRQGIQNLKCHWAMKLIGISRTVKVTLKSGKALLWIKLWKLYNLHIIKAIGSIYSTFTQYNQVPKWNQMYLSGLQHLFWLLKIKYQSQGYYRIREVEGAAIHHLTITEHDHSTALTDWLALPLNIPCGSPTSSYLLWCGHIINTLCLIHTILQK